MKKSGQKGKREESDAENTTVAKRTRKEGAEVPYGIPDGYLELCYKHADGIVEVVEPSFKLPSKLLMNCDNLRDVGLVLKQECDGLDHVRGLGFRFQYLEQHIA